MPDVKAKKVTSPMRPFHVGIAAESAAALAFAQCGCEVAVQYGANQPDYDLMVARGQHLARVSVKGSQLPGWLLIKGKSDVATDLEAWRTRHDGLLFSLVGFAGVDGIALPRLYLASAGEIARYMATQCERMDRTLWESKRWARGQNAGRHCCIPAEWKMTLERVQRLLKPKRAT